MNSRRLHGNERSEAVVRIFVLLIVVAMVCLFVSAPFVLADSGARQETQVTVTDQPIDMP
jgi:hypothetical protein